MRHQLTVQEALYDLGPLGAVALTVTLNQACPRLSEEVRFPTILRA